MFDVELLLRERFTGYRDVLMAQIDAAGPDAVRHTVRRRRAVAVAAGAALAVVLVVAPIAAHAAWNRTTPRPAPADTAAPTSPTPAPTSEPAPKPTVTPSDPPPPSQPPTAPDGRITRTQLLAARVDLPPWRSVVPPSCGVNDVRLRAAPTPDSVPVLLDLTYGDVDDDRAEESLALVECRIGEATAKQAMVFDRTSAGGITTLGQVAGTNARTFEGFSDITDMAVEDDGDVRLQVADIQPCCGTPRNWPQKQWRTYRWDGQGFGQFAGPTAFGPHPRATDLRIASAKFTLGPPDASGRRHGNLAVTISNAGPRDVAFVGFGFNDLQNFEYTEDGGAWSTCARSTADTNCLLPGLEAGQRRTVTFGFSVSQSGLPARGAVSVGQYDADHLSWPDLAWDDNSTEFRLF